jgi:UDP-N-acetylglucosamine 2-epimerase (non-hydrolysing)
VKKPVIALICGTRPEIIKLAPVYHALVQAGWSDVQWIHTGQHADMADAMLRCFGIEPDIRLQRDGTTLEQFSLQCRQQLDQAMATNAWDMSVVQGDTESAFLGALAAFYRHIPIAHVEAGLRTNNLQRPFPEEGLRQMISRLAALHFTPTLRATAALGMEGIAGAKVQLTGNTVVDAQLWATGRGHILVTVHRREHWGQEMDNIFHAIADIAREHPHLQVLFPVHLNPVVKNAAHAILGDVPNVRLTAPLDYLEMQQALADAALLLTDSGGLQEEAPTFGVPVLVLREETERPEAVEAGCALIVGPQRAAIVHEVRRLLHDDLAYRRMQQTGNPYGDGHASERIEASLADFFKQLPARQAVAA